MTNGYFITGTDTDCGKTEITLGLMSALRQQGRSVLGMKPVASGARVTPDGLRNDDALRIQAACSFQIAYEQINPYAFEPPVAPHLAAAQTEQLIDCALIRARYGQLAAQADIVLVEGVGGWRVPLSTTESVSDMAVQLGLPVILVVGMRLGCINHALLTVESILSSGVELVGWIANAVDPQMLAQDDNSNTLVERISAPLLGSVPRLVLPDSATVAQYLNLTPTP